MPEMYAPLTYMHTYIHKCLSACLSVSAYVRVYKNRLQMQSHRDCDRSSRNLTLVLRKRLLLLTSAPFLVTSHLFTGNKSIL